MFTQGKVPENWELLKHNSHIPSNIIQMLYTQNNVHSRQNISRCISNENFIFILFACYIVMPVSGDILISESFNYM